MTDLLLIRHGQAPHNIQGRWEGWGASPLTAEGERQAEAVSRRLALWLPPIRRLYASPLKRAWQTAQPIAQRLGLEPITHSGLREIDFGEVSGLTQGDFREAMPEVYARWQDRTDLTFQYPGGEQRQQFFQRVARALDEIVGEHPAETVAAVSHGGTLRAGLAYLLPDTMTDWWGYALDNCSLTFVRAGHGGNDLVALNDCHHLEAE
ncbi:histidine phosphatase family protein [Chloroflexota bacterium]